MSFLASFAVVDFAAAWAFFLGESSDAFAAEFFLAVSTAFGFGFAVGDDAFFMSSARFAFEKLASPVESGSAGAGLASEDIFVVSAPLLLRIGDVSG